MLLSSNEQLSHFFAPICLTKTLQPQSRILRIAI